MDTCAGGIAQEKALRAVLLFFDGEVWDMAKWAYWFELTGYSEVTTKALCDTVRAALGPPREPIS